MLIKAYRQPRAIKAFGSYSQLTIASQANVAGCSHATTGLCIMVMRALQRAAAIAPPVTLRTLVDDTTVQVIAQES